MHERDAVPHRQHAVSVLFSEPKIPQSTAVICPGMARSCFSALQRAENSSIVYRFIQSRRLREFQCSSASRKFLNDGLINARNDAALRFSALQRAENSSINEQFVVRTPALVFQCSSASRKFLNREAPDGAYLVERCFSALQRAENSSITVGRYDRAYERRFQCSSASRKFLNSSRTPQRQRGCAFQCSSASRKFLNFSKIVGWFDQICFSALQRAENSSISAMRSAKLNWRRFQCSSASRKFLNSLISATVGDCGKGFSALQRAENSSMNLVGNERRGAY